MRLKGYFRLIQGASLPFPKLLRIPERISFRAQIEGARVAKTAASGSESAIVLNLN